MFKFQLAVFLGKEKENGYFGFVAQEKIFFILQVDEGLSLEKGREFLGKIKEYFLKKEINNLNDFEEGLSFLIKEDNLPAHLSFASGYLKDKILYLKTKNEGRVYLYRKNNLGVIIEGNLSASGYLEDGDFFAFTTKKINQFFENDQQFKKYFQNKEVSKIIDEITPVIKAKDDQGLIILLVKFLKDKELIEENFNQEKDININKFNFFDKIKINLADIKKKIKYQKLPNKKIFNIILVIFIFFLLFWSVIFGAKRRQEDKVKKMINETKVEIEKKLSEAQDLAFFNINQSQELINQANEKLNDLSKIVGQREELKIIAQKIKKTQNQILKKEEKIEEEFFDLALDNQNAQGEQLFLGEDILFILDRENNTLYQLSLIKKSLESFNSQEIKNSQFFAVNKDKVFFILENQGIFILEKGNKLKKIIDYDDEWGEIADFNTYNNNLYLLDKGKNEIYKYTPIENGYSEKIIYFKGAAFSLNNSLSMAIDSSVYVLTANNIFKFTAGVQENFNFKLWQPKMNFKKIYTNKNLEKLFLWDKEDGIIFILNKNGSYERQIFNNNLKKAKDFIVFENNLFFILDSKIYKIIL